MVIVKDNINSLAHTMYNCKYHIVFAPKYRRMAFYGNKRIYQESIERGWTNGSIDNWIQRRPFQG